MDQGRIRKIIHIDMDAFYSSVEQRDDLALKGRPVAVGYPAKRGVVAAASYEARRFGVRSAMPSTVAMRKCAELVFVPPRFDVYRAASRQIQAIFMDYTPLVEPLSLDEAYLDVTDNLRSGVSAWATAKEIRKRIHDETELTASAGISYNKFLAKLASDQQKPNGQFAIVPDEGEAFVASLPVAKFHGVGPVTAKMHALGIETRADLRRQTLDFLWNHFGKSGTWYNELARGQDDRPVQPGRERKSSGSETTFPEDLIDPGRIEAGVVAMADEVWTWCERANSRGRTATVKIKWADFRISTRSRSLEVTIDTRDRLHEVALDLIRSVFPPPKGVRLVGVALSTSLDLLRALAERGGQAPLFIVATTRPEFRPSWDTRSHHSLISLAPLDSAQVRKMVSEIASRHALSKDVVDGVGERTGGVPLFVEEVTRLLLERGEQGGVQAIPPTLQQSLAARLDRLGPARETAQIGAVLGRSFSYALLHSVAAVADGGAALAERGESEAGLHPALDRLAEADILIAEGVGAQATYRFKHALIQDAAYDSLLRSRRQALHRRAAEILRDIPERAAAEPEAIAHHFTQAGVDDLAVEWWGRAADQALRRSALVEAVVQLTRALAQIATLPSTSALRRKQIELQVALITPLLHVKGYAAPETKAAVERARLLVGESEALGERSEDPLLLFSVLYGFWVVNYVAFKGDVCCDLAAQFLALAEKQEATVLLMIGHRLLGASLLFTGDITQGRAQYDQALALYDPGEHRVLAARFGQDVRVAILSYRSLALWILGYPTAALADLNRAISDAREIGQASTLMYALAHAPLLLLLSRSFEAAAADAREVIALADEKGAVIWKAAAMAFLGCTFAFSGETSNAVEAVVSGIAAWRATGSTLWTPLFLLGLARAHAQLGQFDDAWGAIGEATTTMATTKEKWCEAELHRVAGEIALVSPEADMAKAEAHFALALALARAQQAKSWESRASTSLARLWRDQGKRDAARGLLAPVYGWFTEGLDTLDLKEAKALLDGLA